MKHFLTLKTIIQPSTPFTLTNYEQNLLIKFVIKFPE